MFSISSRRIVILALALTIGSENQLIHARVGSPLAPATERMVASAVETAAIPFAIYVAPWGSPDNPGTSESPVDSLVSACRLVDFRRGVSHTIYVRGGTYFDQSTIWSPEAGGMEQPHECKNRYSLSASLSLTITAYGQERPVFEGRGHRVLLDVRSRVGACSNVTISGLTIRQYVVTFPYPNSPFQHIRLICDTTPCDASTFIDQGQRFFAGGKQYAEQVGAMTTGDFNGDGREELVVAFNYRMLDSPDSFVKIVRTGEGPDRHLSKVLYTSPSFTAHALATGDFDRRGRDQLLTYLRLQSSGRGEIWRGDGIASIVNFGRLYQTTTWGITAMTAGDFDGNGTDESMVALQNGAGETRIYRGNGVSSVLSDGAIYTTTNWRVPAMTTGDFDADGQDELITALQRSTEARIVRGDGTASVAGYGTVYSSTIWEIAALAAGAFTADGARLVTAFRNRNTGETRLYQGNGVTSATGIRFYTSSSWNVSAVVAKRLDSNAGAELATAFTWPTRIQIWAGDGTTSATRRGLFHRWPAF
jgi:hypothetical protein